MQGAKNSKAVGLVLMKIEKLTVEQLKTKNCLRFNPHQVSYNFLHVNQGDPVAVAVICCSRFMKNIFIT